MKKNALENQKRYQKKKTQKKNVDLHFKQNEFTKKSEFFAESIIDYPNSPTGKAYIGFAKRPLMPNPSGIGYKGVKVQSENRELIECSGCGGWFQTINSWHLSKCTGDTYEEYKEKFGYNKGCALVSDVRSNDMHENIMKNSQLAPTTNRVDMMRKALVYKQKGIKTTDEYRNLKGTCEEQLKHRLISYIHRFKILPSSNSHRENFSCRTYSLRFGSLNKAFAHYGLPTRRQIGRTTEYIFPDKTVARTISGDGYENVFSLMKEKCPVLFDTFN